MNQSKNITPWQNLAIAIIRHNIRDNSFLKSEWCKLLQEFCNCPDLKIEPREPVVRTINRLKYPIEFKKKVCKEYDNGKNMIELAQEYNIAKSTVCKWVEEYSSRDQEMGNPHKTKVNEERFVFDKRDCKGGKE